MGQRVNHRMPAGARCLRGGGDGVGVGVGVRRFENPILFGLSLRSRTRFAPVARRRNRRIENSTPHLRRHVVLLDFAGSAPLHTFGEIEGAITVAPHGSIFLKIAPIRVFVK
jgi:hypothetical protein